MLLQLELVAERLGFCYKLKQVGSLAALVTSSHRAFKALLRRVASAMGMSTADVGELSVVCYDMGDAGESEGLMIRRLAERFRFILPAGAVLPATRKKPAQRSFDP